MFEHLGPTIKRKPGKKVNSFKLYAGLLVLAVLVFFLSLNASTGPNSSASSQNNFEAELNWSEVETTVVADTPRISLMDFAINTHSDRAALRKIKLTIDGVYSPDIFQHIYLLANGVQVGLPENVDNFGNVYFDVDNLPLKNGQNIFSIVLANEKIIRAGDIIQLSIPDADSVFLSFDGHLFSPNYRYPLNGGSISFVDVGSVWTQNNLLDNDQVLLVGRSQRIADFSILPSGESSDLGQIVLTYTGASSKDLADGRFDLMEGKNLLAQGRLENSKIFFDLDQPKRISQSDRLNLQIYATVNVEKDIVFAIDSMSARGYASGRNVTVINRPVLGQVAYRSFFPTFSASSQTARAGEGWNNLYNFDLDAAGTDVEIQKISFDVRSLGADVSDLQLWVNDQPSSAVWRTENDLQVFDFINPLNITEKTRVSLLGKIVGQQKQWTVQALLKFDQKPFVDTSSSYIVWSVGQTVSNSYNLPYLPLEPAILSN